MDQGQVQGRHSPRATRQTKDRFLTPPRPKQRKVCPGAPRRPSRNRSDGVRSYPGLSARVLDFTSVAD